MSAYCARNSLGTQDAQVEKRDGRLFPPELCFPKGETTDNGIHVSYIEY